MLPPSLAVFQAPLSPYWMPLIGSSGSMSPSSILVRIILARRPKISSTPSPFKALASVTTDMAAVLAHRLASALVTSRPSGATVAFCCAPNPAELPGSRDDGVPVEPPTEGMEKELVAALVPSVADPTLLGVAGGSVVSTEGSEVRSSLFPTSMRLRLGDARARASLRNGCSNRKEPCDVIS